ncbi:C-terminal binding protein [Aquibaculum sediminis]|uniref:C-terminal binding protein n=1 Tax=Aquibaculum sediminis TaxID=3231907 RepID=UPI00345631B6
MARFRILVPDAKFDDDGVIERRLSGADYDWTICRAKTMDQLPAEVLDSCDGIVTWHVLRFDPALVARLQRCRIIVRAGVGYDHIDLDSTAAAGIAVSNTPDYGTMEVADHALAMALVLSRGLLRYHTELLADSRGAFNSAASMGQRRLTGQTFAVLGIGRIGTAAALRAKAFGFRVVCYDPYASRGVERALGIERVESLDELLAQADVLSLHAPLTAETRNILGAEALGKIKPGAVLVNTARGGLTDPEAVLEALRDGRLAAAGLDVFPQEPIDPETPWYKTWVEQPAWLRGRLLLSPHTAWLSDESRQDARSKAVETLMAFLERGELRNCVNGMTAEAVRSNLS